MDNDLEKSDSREDEKSANLETVHIPLKTIEPVSTNGHNNTENKPGLALEKVERAITKQGVCNFVPANVEKQNRKFATDIFTTLLEVRWRWTLLAFCVVYFGTWFIFSILWYLILYLNGDIEHFGEEDWDPCITGIQNYTSAFLFSVETQHTTGYGFYELKEKCPSAVILFCFQSIVGCILEGVMVGMVFVKLGRAKRRSETIMFSRNAVISLRDGVLCFMFRVADMRKTHLIEAQVRAQLVKKRTTKEGEVIPYNQEELKVGGDGEWRNKILMFWPTTIVHKITDLSPLWGLSPEQLQSNSYEIIVVLEGINGATGLNVQARSSYLPSEILWGRRFEILDSTKTSSGHREIDYSQFHQTVPVPMDSYIEEGSS